MISAVIITGIKTPVICPSLCMQETKPGTNAGPRNALENVKTGKNKRVGEDHEREKATLWMEFVHNAVRTAFVTFRYNFVASSV